LVDYIIESSINPDPNTFADGVITWGPFTIPEGESQEITYDVTIPSEVTAVNCEGEFTNTVEVTPDSGETNTVVKVIVYKCNCQSLPSTAIITDKVDRTIISFILVLLGVVFYRLKVFDKLFSSFIKFNDFYLWEYMSEGRGAEAKKRKLEDKFNKS